MSSAAQIALLDLRLRRRAAIGYALGLAAYVGIIVALYPAFKDDAGLDEFTRKSSTVAAVFGASGSLTSPTGWMNANVYANFLPLIVLILGMGYGASCIAGQDEDGTLALVATLPVSRRRLVLQKIAVLVLQVMPATVLTVVVVLAGRGAGITLGAGPVVATTFATLLLAVDFGLLAMFIGARTGSRGTALGVASGLAALSYLISSLAPATHWVRPLRVGSLFYWAVGNGQLGDGVSAGSVLVLVAVAVALVVAVTHAFERLDLH